MSHRRLGLAVSLAALALLASPTVPAQEPAKTPAPAPAQAPAAEAKKAGDPPAQEPAKTQSPANDSKKAGDPPAQEPAKTQDPTAADTKKAGDPPPAVDPNAPQIVRDLTARYRFSERYTSRTEKAPFGSVGQFQVAFRETFTVDDPKVKEPRTVQAIFSERPVDVRVDDERIVTDSIRHYTSVNITPDPWKSRADRRPLEDLTIWYRDVAKEVPLVLVLTPNRPLREEEYKFAISYTFVTDLAFLLPEAAMRIGESWRIAPKGAVALVNDEVREGFLVGKLVEIRVYPKNPKTPIAVINVSGKVVTGDRDVRDTTVNARIEFAFTPTRRPGDDGVVEAVGAIEKVRLAQLSSLRVIGVTRTRTTKRDLSLDLKRPGNDPIHPLPKPIPVPTPENSWLTYVDPKGRFRLRHPQGFQPDFPPNMPNTVNMKYFHADIKDDLVGITFVEKPVGRAEASFQGLVAEWRRLGVEVQLGVNEKLPDADWPDLSVHHMEAALTSPNQSGQPERRYFDAYVIQFPRNVSLFITATTFQEQPEAFRAQVRAMLKTVKLGPPSKGQ
jgi:hypothetical protein